MAILSKVYIIACLLLNVLMCQRQEHLVYSVNQLHPEAMDMAKHPRSYDWEDPNPIRSSQMGVAICPAEDPNDVRFENHPNANLNWRNMVKDEDDGEDLDMAAGGDEDDDEERDECNGTGVDDMIGDDPAFVARISCLMSALDRHIKAIACNVNNIGSHLASLKPTGICGKTHEEKEPKPKTKCSKKPKCFQEKQRDNQDDGNGPSGRNLDHNPFHLQFHSQNGGSISPPGPGTHSQNSGGIHLQGSGIHLQNRADISPPGSGIHFQTGGDTNSLPGVGATVSPRISDLKIIYPAPEHFNHKPYEEYETNLRRLMANRDAIEKNVMRMLAPRHGERM